MYSINLLHDAHVNLYASILLASHLCIVNQFMHKRLGSYGSSQPKSQVSVNEPQMVDGYMRRRLNFVNENICVVSEVFLRKCSLSFSFAPCLWYYLEVFLRKSGSIWNLFFTVILLALLFPSFICLPLFPFCC